jgi:hypothetical protein
MRKNKIFLRREEGKKTKEKRERGEFDLYVTSKGERSLAWMGEKNEIGLAQIG